MKIYFVLFFSLLMPFAAQASLETRVGYGMNAFDDKYTGLELTDSTTINADIILNLDIFYGFGLGLRYETMSFDFNLSSNKVSEGELKRFALLANYRFVDSTFYAGAIGTTGFQNTFETISNSITDTKYDAKMNFSLGLEAGVNAGRFSVGLEAGQLFAVVENPDSPDMSLNSMYAKVFIGIVFFRDAAKFSSRGRFRGR